MYPSHSNPDRDADALKSVFIGYLVGMTTFVILFSIVQSVQFARLGALFIGATFGLSVFYRIHRK